MFGRGDRLSRPGYVRPVPEDLDGAQLPTRRPVAACGSPSLVPWLFTSNDACRRDILSRLAESGPRSSRDLPGTCAVPWRSTGWTDHRNVTQLLELMVSRGEAAIAGRRGADRLWDRAARVRRSAGDAQARGLAPVGLRRAADPLRRRSGRQARAQGRPHGGGAPGHGRPHGAGAPGQGDPPGRPVHRGRDRGDRRRAQGPGVSARTGSHASQVTHETRYHQTGP